MSTDANWIRAIVHSAAHELVEQLEELDRGQELGELCADVQRVLDACLTQLSSTGLWGPENSLPSSELWLRAKPFLQLGRLQVHARTKPFGYAGDHQMLLWICRDQREGTRLGWAFDDYFQRQAAPQAVRNRALLVAEQIVSAVRDRPDRHVKVVSVGSGPAEDIALARSLLDADECQRLDVHLVDLDPRALDFCGARFAGSVDKPLGNLSLHRRNLKRLSETEPFLNQADLIACPGFLDYLEPSEVARILRVFFSALRESGLLYAFNFATDNPSRAYMEWIGNWYLVYRSPDDLRAARHQAGIPSSCEVVGAEAENVNLYLRVIKC